MIDDSSSISPNVYPKHSLIFSSSSSKRSSCSAPCPAPSLPPLVSSSPFSCQCCTLAMPSTIASGLARSSCSLDSVSIRPLEKLPNRHRPNRMKRSENMIFMTVMINKYLFMVCTMLLFGWLLYCCLFILSSKPAAKYFSIITCLKHFRFLLYL